MIRLIPLALLLLVLAACGGDEATDDEQVAAEPDPTPTATIAAEPTEEHEPTPTPELEPTETPTPSPTPEPEKQTETALDIDPAAFILTREEMGDGWRRGEVEVDRETEATEEQFCGWGEEFPDASTNATASFESTDSSLLIQYVYVFEEGQAADSIQSFADHISGCDVWREATEQGEMTTYIASFPMPNLGDDAVSFHMEMEHESGTNLGEFVLLYTRYDDLIVAMGTMQSQSINLGRRGSDYMHRIDRKVRDNLGRTLAGWGDPISTTHGLEITPLSISITEAHGFPDNVTWQLEFEVCSSRDGTAVSSDIGGEFDVESSRGASDGWSSGTLDAGECRSGYVLLLTDTEDAQLRSVRYSITPSIVDPYGWLEWELRDQ